MLRIVFAIMLGSCFASALNAQDLQGKISCWGQGSLQPQNRAHTKKLWDGYEVSLGPTPHSADNPGITKTKMKAAFAEFIKQDYPAFAARLISQGGIASSETGKLPRTIHWLKELSDDETFLAAKLTEAEQKQIIDQVEKTSFDAPDSWESELRVRRVSLGESEGLLIRGTRLLCGGTGNCESWVFRRSQRNWINLFDQEAPIASGFAFEDEATGGIKNFLVSANSSTAKESRILFRFDGKFYRQNECYDVSVNAPGADQIQKVPCKSTEPGNK
jgi:hypothetical protein